MNDLRTSAARLAQRRAAAAAGHFLLEDGTDMGQVLNTLDDAEARLAQAELEMESLAAEIEAGKRTVEAARQALERARLSAVTGPPGALVWSLISAPGAPVAAGAPVASWIDCKILLVDVPASDVEIALLRVGDVARVILEGERSEREGRVMLLRGSAAAVGGNDPAAIAKGRKAGVGQVLLRLRPSAQDIEQCPISHAAFVEFPEMDFIDLVLARLRL